MLTVCFLLSTVFIRAQSADELNRMGVEMIQSGEYDKAMEHFENALRKADVNAARVYHNIGVSYEKQGRLEEAARNYDEAVRRNPKQIQSFERGGRVHFQLKQYSRAVQLGKAGMQLDPVNREIPRWLESAYDRAYAEEKTELLPSSGKLDYPPPWTFRMGVESGVIGALNTDPYGLSLAGNEGFLVDITSKVHAEYIHDNRWGGRIVLGNPYYGALLPDTVSLMERAEGYYLKDNFYIGGGVLVSHYSGSRYFGTNKTLTDFKLGFMYGYHGEKNKVDLYFYPKFLPSDSKYGDDYTMDVSVFDISWVRAYDRRFDLYGAFSINEFFFYNNKAGRSHYDGTYDLSGGCILNNRYDSLFTVYLYLTERVYMQNYDNEKPYESLNGQGLFGLDAGNWFLGDPFSGIRSFSHVLNARFEHNITPNWKVYEQIGIEYCGSGAKRHDLTAWIGIEGGY
ncbi:MAG: tetratricopeptide repeat protein [Spirochaetota bacterium]